MKKYGILFLIIILILGMLFSLQYVYATDSFFEVENTEVSKDGDIKLIINLDKVIYDKFEFELVSDTTLSNIETDEEVEIENYDDENEIYIKINKKETNLNKIVLNYKMPEDIEVGDTITFIASITDLENDEEVQTTEPIEITIIENKEEQEENIENKEQIDENKENEESIITNQDKNNEEQISNGKTELENQNNNMIDSTKKESDTNNISNMQSTISTKTESSQTSSEKQTTETVTYNGSNNNYLSNLYIEGYNLNKEFCKDNNTYIVNLENNVDSINIITEKEDDTATICIYGNDNLKEGTNKVLINVTAENGNVRTYRIYIIINT